MEGTVQVPLHLVTEQDVRNFLATQPDRQQIEARTADELRLMCSLYQGGSGGLSREACIAFLEDVVQRELSPTGWQATGQVRDEWPKQLSQSGRETMVSQGMLPPPVSEPRQFSDHYGVKKNPPVSLGVPPGLSAIHPAPVYYSTPRATQVPVGAPGFLSESQLQFQLKKMELEAEERRAEREREAEERRAEREREERERERQFELERIRVGAERGRERGVEHGIRGREESAEIQLTRSLKLVPAFDEAKVTEWFLRFEKKAREYNWPRERWVGLVANVLKGKALEAYDAMTIEELEDYDYVKERILKAYELRPEAYRLLFRGAKKRPNETHVEYARYLRDTFSKWLSSEKVETLEDMRQLMLLEHFINNTERDLGIKLREKRLKTVAEAAVWADDRVLAVRGAERRSGLSVPARNRPGQGAAPAESTLSRTEAGKKSPNTERRSKGASKAVSCYFCKELGHIKPNCPKWKASLGARPVSLVVEASRVEESDFRRGEHAGETLCGPDHCVKSADLVPVSGNSVGSPEESVNSSTLDWCKAFIHPGVVEIMGKSYPVKVFRDTGAKQSMCRNITGGSVHTGEYVVCQGVHSDACHDLVPMTLECPLVSAAGKVAVLDKLPVDGVDFLLGADLAGDRVFPPPVVVSERAGVDPETAGFPEVEQESALYPVCAVTRSMAQVAQLDDGESITEVGAESLDDGSPTSHRRSDDDQERSEVSASQSDGALIDPIGATERESDDEESSEVLEAIDVAPREVSGVCGDSSTRPSTEISLQSSQLASVGPRELSQRQREDPTLVSLFAKVVAEKGPGGDRESFLVKGQVLYRQWNARQVAGDRLQLVVPGGYRPPLIRLAHESPLAGHMGVRKTVDRLQYRFWWPRMRGEVATFIQRCHLCQVVGKPNQRIPAAPLLPIPAVEPPFTRVIIDMVGPLPRTSSGKKYLLTIMDVTTRYPEAIPTSSSQAKPVMKQLLGFFTRYGFPREVQSDRGVNFTSNLFKTTFKELGVSQILSSAYHPQTQGSLERHHQTLKSLIKKFCYEHEKDWDVAIPFVLFAIREVPTESLGFSPNELVFGHRVRGPLDVVYEGWSGQADSAEPLLDMVSKTRIRLHQALDLARSNLLTAQNRMKTHYDKKSMKREFKVGDEVLALLPVQGSPLAAQFSGPYQITQKVGPLDYLVATPDRRKSHQLCHINMLKPYYRPIPLVGLPASGGSQGSESHLIGDQAISQAMDAHIPAPVLAVGTKEEKEEEYYCEAVPAGLWEGNGYQALREKLSHLTAGQREELCARLWQYDQVFRDSPGRTTWAIHDVDVGENKPVKLPPYRLNPLKNQALAAELTYMLDRGLIEKGYSEWSSPVTLQPKPDGKIRFCIDFRKVNSLSKSDNYPLPRVDDSVDLIGAATFITKIDLVKGYWQVPLTERAKKVASFVVSGGLYQCQVMPYGLKNAPATFQRLMDRVVDGIPNCTVYIDDVIIYDTSWESHVDNVEHLVRRLNEAGLVVNLAKCDFVKAEVQYLGYVVGHGKVRPPQAKVEAIREFAPPKSRKALQRFLGMIGYYRRFIRNYSTVLAPLTDLLRKDQKFRWSEECDRVFGVVKTLLCHHPILSAPDFDMPFILAVDASDVGAGAVLLQLRDRVEHPVCFFSKKFNRAQRNYSVVEKELLALILALQHFAVYLPPCGPPITIYTDHHPLQFLAKFRNKNQRLTRWSLLLQEYTLEIRHIRGVDNVLADCLSREGMVT